MTSVVKYLTTLVPPSSSYPGHVLAVHCNGGFLQEHIHSGNSGRCAFTADPDVHNHAEPQLSGLVAQRCHFKRPFSSYRSRHAIKGVEVANLADAAVAQFDLTTSEPVSYTTNLFAGTGQLFTLHQPRGLAHTLGLAFFVHHCLAHLETYSVCIVKSFIFRVGE